MTSNEISPSVRMYSGKATIRMTVPMMAFTTPKISAMSRYVSTSAVVSGRVRVHGDAADDQRREPEGEGVDDQSEQESHGTPSCAVGSRTKPVRSLDR